MAEYAIVVLIIALQCLVFLRNWQRINQYHNAIPETYGITEAPARLSVPGAEDKGSPHAELTDGINGYLEASSGGSPDFNLIRDITERHTGVQEEAINQTLSVPLYLGLMGTMIGIVAGLWNMSSVSEAINTTGGGDAIGDGINILLGGVKIAMIASFTGIGFTVLASSLLFNKAHRITEKRKNQFYTFLQKSLMPAINKDANLVIHGLQNNMIAFSQHFEQNLVRMEGILNSNRQDLELQRDILAKLDAIDINQFAKANVQVLQELLRGTHKLEQFNKYLTNMVTFVGASQTLSNAFNQMLNRTADIEGVLKNIDTHFAMSGELMLFLKSHFSQLEARGGLIQQAIIGVDTVLDDGLNQLKEHVSAKLAAIKEMTTLEQAQLSKALEGSKDGLSKLSYLEEIDAEVKKIRLTSPEQYKQLLSKFTSLQTKVNESVNVLMQINENQKSWYLKVYNWIKKKI